MERKCVKIGNKIVGDGYPCFIIAEIGINHNGSVLIKKKMIDQKCFVIVFHINLLIKYIILTILHIFINK